MVEAPAVTLTRLASSTEPLRQRAQAVLGALRPLVPFDAAWLALADPLDGSYTSLASSDLDDGVVDYLSGPAMAQDIRATGTDRERPPLSPSDLPYPACELPTWSECLHPAGIHEALSVGLFAPEGRHVGFLALLSGDQAPPTSEARRRLDELAPVLAEAIDPLRALVTTARLVRGATAGAALRRDGLTQPLPGLQDHPLLGRGSPVVRLAAGRVADGQEYAAFLWPLGGRYAPDGHVRVSVVAAQDGGPTALTGAVLPSPPPDLHGLTPRELEVLGMLVDGRSNRGVARSLVVAQRTVATHVEHVLAKLQAATRTHAAVRAEREGLYFPDAARSAGRAPG